MDIFSCLFSERALPREKYIDYFYFAFIPPVFPKAADNPARAHNPYIWAMKKIYLE